MRKASRISPAGSGPRSVAVGDFNGDGVQDLAVAAGSGTTVLLGNGDGSFQAALNFGARVNPQSVAILQRSDEVEVPFARPDSA